MIGLLVAAAILTSGVQSTSDGAAAKMRPLPPKGPGNCDPGPCARSQPPAPPPTLEHVPGGVGDGLNWPVFVKNDTCNAAYGPTVERAQVVIRMKGGGAWSQRFVIRRKGHVSIWCVYRAGGSPPTYAFAEGGTSPGEASRKAREDALRMAGGDAGMIRLISFWNIK